ncbi:hypothetical protein BZU93_29975 [Salmonella enterica subsp. enterica]|nr:hypothetical protein [Salmonella enterica subsp. enterica serovar Enteritidis]
MTQDDIFRRYMAANRKVQAVQNEEGQFIPVSVLNTLLGVYLWGGDRGGDPVNMAEMAKRLDIKPTTLSGHLAYLGERYRTTRTGLGLVEMRLNPANHRNRYVVPTPAGYRLARELLEAFDDNDA